jgi:hypothetical protein
MWRSLQGRYLTESVAKFRRWLLGIERTVHRLVNKRRRAGCLLKKKRQQMRCVLAEGTLDDIGDGLEITPRKHLRRLSRETYVIGIRTRNHKIASFEIYKFTTCRTARKEAMIRCTVL